MGFLLETACRREGLLNLTPASLRPQRQTVLLDEKNTKIREQPISALIAEQLANPDGLLYGWTPQGPGKVVECPDWTGLGEARRVW
jgi:integrase/recombinase XerC